MFAPRLIELCFQTAGVWEIGSTGQLGLPAAAEKVTVWSLPSESAKLVAEVFPRDGNGGAKGLCFDAHVRDASGKVYVELKGYTTSQMPGKLPDGRLRPVPGCGDAGVGCSVPVIPSVRSGVEGGRGPDYEPGR